MARKSSGSGSGLRSIVRRVKSRAKRVSTSKTSKKSTPSKTSSSTTRKSSGGGGGGSVTFRSKTTGKVISAPLAGRTVEQAVKEEAAKQEQEQQVKVSASQRAAARRQVGGPIERIETDKTKGEVTFVGATGKKATFPVGKLTFTGADRPGGLRSDEAPAPSEGKPLAFGRKVVQSLSEKQQAQQGQVKTLRETEQLRLTRTSQLQPTLAERSPDARVASPPGPLSLGRRIDISLSTGETIGEFFSREGFRVDRRTQPFPERFKRTFFNIQLLSARGFARPLKFVKEQPVVAGASVLGVGGALFVGARALTLTTGVKLATAKSIVSVGALGTFAGIKEFREPGSVTTLPGGIETASEFTTFAIGVKAAGVGIKAARIASPRFIPFVTTSTKRPAPARSVEQIPMFEGTTRRGTAIEQAIVPAGKESTFFTTTATTPRGFFGLFRGIKTTPEFTVKEPPRAEIGADRRAFGEDFLFLSRKEAFPMFAEEGIGRLGQVSRLPSGSAVKKSAVFAGRLVTEAPRRFSELFLRAEQPTILRFQETLTGFSRTSAKRITRGETGPGLRRTLVAEVKAQPGKIFPGTRTSALGSGELEAVTVPGTRIFQLTGPERFTYLPRSGTFAKVIDAGLQPGTATRGSFNILGRAKNIGAIATRDIFGINIGIRPRVEKIGKAARVTTRGRTSTHRLTIRAVPGRARVATLPFGRVTRARARETPRIIPRPIPRPRPREPIRIRPRTREPPRRDPPRREPPREPPRPPPRVPPRRPPRTPPRVPPRAPSRRPPRRPTRILPPVTRPPTAPPRLGALKRGFAFPTTTRKKKRRLGIFNPTLEATSTLTFGQRPEILTGFGARPIPIGRTPTFKF